MSRNFRQNDGSSEGIIDTDLFVSKIPPDLTADQLTQLFSSVAEPVRCRFYDGRKYGFAKYRSHSDARKTLEAVVSSNTYRLGVEFARKNSEKNDRHTQPVAPVSTPSTPFETKLTSFVEPSHSSPTENVVFGLDPSVRPPGVQMILNKPIKIGDRRSLNGRACYDADYGAPNSGHQDVDVCTNPRVDSSSDECAYCGGMTRESCVICKTPYCSYNCLRDDKMIHMSYCNKLTMSCDVSRSRRDSESSNGSVRNGRFMTQGPKKLNFPTRFVQEPPSTSTPIDSMSNRLSGDFQPPRRNETSNRHSFQGDNVSQYKRNTAPKPRWENVRNNERGPSLMEKRMDRLKVSGDSTSQAEESPVKDVSPVPSQVGEKESKRSPAGSVVNFDRSKQSPRGSEIGHKKPSPAGSMANFDRSKQSPSGSEIGNKKPSPAGSGANYNMSEQSACGFETTNKKSSPAGSEASAKQSKKVDSECPKSDLSASSSVSDSSMKVLVLFREGDSYWVRPWMKKKTYEDIMLRLKNDVRAKLLKPVQPEKDLKCVAPYLGEHYRAQVLSVSPSLMVKYIDFGNNEECDADSLLTLPNDLKIVPDLAHHIKLASDTDPKYLKIDLEDRELNVRTVEKQGNMRIVRIVEPEDVKSSRSSVGKPIQADEANDPLKTVGAEIPTHRMNGHVSPDTTTVGTSVIDELSNNAEGICLLTDRNKNHGTLLLEPYVSLLQSNKDLKIDSPINLTATQANNIHERQMRPLLHLLRTVTLETPVHSFPFRLPPSLDPYFTPIPTRTDGNCFYYAVSTLLCGNEGLAGGLRALVAYHLDLNRAYMDKLLVVSGPCLSRSSVLRDRNFAEINEVVIIGNILRRSINIYTIPAAEHSMRFEADTGSTELYLLLDLEAKHYTALLPKRIPALPLPDATQHLPPISDFITLD